MAIQMRRGEYSKFDPSKLLPGEVAVVMSGDTTTASGRGVYVCVSAGTVVRVPTVEDAVAMIADAYPEAKVTRYSGYAILEVTAPDGTKTTARVNDGVSPSVAVTPIEGGSDVTITDAGGTKTVRIMNGISAPRSLANLLTRSLPEASSQTVDDAAKTPLVGATVYGKSTQDGTPTPDAPVAIQSVGPNLAVTPYRRFNFTTTRGVTYSQNADGSITASGTATSWAYLDLCNQSDNPFGLERGKVYTFVTSSRVAFVMTVTGGTSASKARVMTIPETGNWTVGVGVASGSTIDETFRFSVFEGGTTPQTAVPYDGIGLLARGRNLYDVKAGGATADVEWSVDGSVLTMSGTASGASYFTPKNGIMMPAGTYTFSASGNAEVRFNGTVGNSVTKTFAEPWDITLAKVYLRSGTSYSGAYTLMLEVGAIAHAYEPYKESVTAIPLDGHTLRSLPDGTRDEVTVDQYGHVTLVQRVVSFGPNDQWTLGQGGTPNSHGIAFVYRTTGMSGSQLDVGANMLMSNVPKSTALFGDTTDRCAACNVNTLFYHFPSNGTATLESGLADMAAHNGEFLIPLATPVTHDLGTIDPTALVGPDMTAQAVPTAPFALTYERDLNTTLARLEAAIADAATA